MLELLLLGGRCRHDVLQLLQRRCGGLEARLPSWLPARLLQLLLLLLPLPCLCHALVCAAGRAADMTRRRSSFRLLPLRLLFLLLYLLL